MSPRVLIVIPAYNEEATIPDVIRGLRRSAPEYDRVVINDGSEDGTGRIIERMSERQVSLPLNLGYGGAMQTGLKYMLARGHDIVVFFDADGQHRPEDVPRLVAAMQNTGADIVIGSRFCDGRGHTGRLSRRLGQILLSLLTSVLIRQRIQDTTSGFKALRASACRALVTGTFLDFHAEALVRLHLLGFKVAEVPITVDERTFGRSMYSGLSAVQYPVKTILLTLVAAIDGLLTRRWK